MKRPVFIISLLAACLLLNARAYAEHEGPFVIYEDGGTRVISTNIDGVISDTVYKTLRDNFTVNVSSANGKYSFDVKPHRHYKSKWKQAAPKKTLVVSDLHGNIDAFVALMTSNGVMDKDYNWSFGKNQLIIIGDIMDRGIDDTAIFWLAYKLEQQAIKAHGRVDFLIGNHEDMVLRGDLRYVNKAHIEFAEKTGITWDKLWGADTELGKWIRKSNMAIVVGDNLFVHAGLSRALAEKEFSVKEINKMTAGYIGIPSKDRNEINERVKFFFGSDGPLWYRGLVFNSEKYPAIADEDLDKVLEYYKVKRIIVGHSEVDDIEWRYGGRVIAVNARHYDSYGKNMTGGLLIEGGKLYSVNYSGDKIPLE